MARIRSGSQIMASFPSWSPDGKKIAFVEGAENDIFVINADGTGLTRLTDSPGRDTHPSWSPDGTKIAFATDRDLVQEPGGGLCFCNLQIYVMNADGTSQTRITHSTTQDNEPSWGVAIDDSPPDTTITSASYHHGRTLTNGQHIRQATVTFTFKGRDNVGISGFECKLDSGAFSKCSSPITYAVSKGVHTFKVKAIDLSGNPDPTPATFTWIRGK
ncbi:MAG: hypothetical protein E6K92_05025 [Thaumarchaeota archaeon]|nr:MAG: hypothetical protein E6K92_05025 [Nitrososphaerota archaeon]